MKNSVSIARPPLLDEKKYSYRKVRSDDVAICDKSDLEFSEDFDSENSDEDEPNIEDIKETYREMYDNWIKICNVNKSLIDKLSMLANENVELKTALVNLKNLVKEKNEKI